MAVEGVSTKKNFRTDKEAGEKDEAKTKASLSDLEVLVEPSREYTIGGKEFVQKPLVMRDFGRLFEHLMEMLNIAIAVNPDLLKSGQLEIDTDNISPQLLIGLANSSSDMMEKVYDIVTMLLIAERNFLLNNLHISQFTRILADAIELNDLKEVIANFSRMGRQVREYLQKK